MGFAKPYFPSSSSPTISCGSMASIGINPTTIFFPATSTPSRPISSRLFSPHVLERGKGGWPSMAMGRGGGGGYYRPGPSGGGSRRNRRDNRIADSDYDAALDLDRIQSSTVRLLDQEQNMIGVMSINEATRMADDAELILAILSPDADPPVLRLFASMDYKKHIYEQQKKKRVQQKRSAANRVDIKELKMGYNIDSHDYSVRLRAAMKFLKDGDKVKIMVNLKGRENEFRNNAIELIKRFQNDVGELAVEEAKNLRERNIFIVLVPNKAVLQKAQDQPKINDADAPNREVSANV